MLALEPRPRFRQRKTLAVILLLAFATFGIIVTNLCTPSVILNGALLNGKITLTPQPVHWSLPLITTFFISLFTVSAYELLSVVLQWGLWVKFDRKVFDQFFGDDASDLCGAGVIQLQADKIDVLLKQYQESPYQKNPMPNIKAAIDSKPDGRLFKAREWMNYFDTIGAKEIIRQFRDLGLDSPQLHPIERSALIDEAMHPEEQPPFIISMGLGFSVKTDKLLQHVCDGWMKVSLVERYGDVLDLLQNLVPNQLKLLEVVVAENPNFRRLLPKGDWTLTKWLEFVSTRDYAIILRHTEKNRQGRRQMKFVLAGFTERGTAAAGEYLARNWKQLWQAYVKNDYKKDGLGDFMLVIEGPSQWKDIKEWSSDPYLGAITPERLAVSAPYLNTPWVARIRKR